MTGVIATIPRVQFSNALGIPLAGGKLITYAAGTNTPAPTYQDRELTIANPTSIPLDSTGSCVLWLDPEKSYKFVLKNELGVTQPGWPVDNISGAGTPTSMTPTFSLFAKISALAAAAGATLVGYVQAGVGAIKRTVQSKLRERVSVLDFMTEAEREDVLSCTGALDVGAACDKARDHVLTLGRKGKLRFPAGVYSRATSWDFSYPGLFVEGDSRFSTVLKYTGNGTAVRVDDSRPNHNEYAYTHFLTDLCIEGTANAQVLLYLKNVNHVNWSNINLREANNVTGVGFLINGSVCGHFSNIVCSSNGQPMTHRPFTGLVVDRDPTGPAYTRATDNTFINCIFEGESGDGIQLVNSDQSFFLGGTSENNVGNGVTIAPGSRMNTFISMGFENSMGFADIYDGGFSNKFINCYTLNLIHIASSSLMSEISGGFHQSITANGDFATVQDLKYSFFAPGGTVNFGPTTSSRNVFNADTSSMTFALKAPAAVFVTDSPFEYVNGSGLDEEVIITGGLVTQVVFDRAGPVANLPVSGMFRLAPTDKLKISYTPGSPPTVVRIPFGSNYI